MKVGLVGTYPVVFPEQVLTVVVKVVVNSSQRYFGTVMARIIGSV
jgi:hypothetical protein